VRIGIDIVTLSQARQKTGLFYYIDHLTRQLQDDADHRCTLYCARGDGSWARKTFTGRRVRSLRPPPRFYRVWRAMAAFNRSDVYLHNLLSDIGPITRGANVYCVPDVIPLAISGGVPASDIGFYRAYYDEAVRNSSDIICWAEHAKRDLLAKVGGDPERVHVVPLAAGPEFSPVGQAELPGRLAGTGLAPGSYVLGVASIETRKNYPVLLRAFARLLARDGRLPHRLALAGAKGYGHKAVFDEAARLGLSDRVIHLGYAADLPALYSGAAAFAFPSRYEGFGLPPLEAMACGTPVVCSDATSLPEVVGDAALLFDPDDEIALADHLHRLLTDPLARADYAARALVRSGRFSWGQTAAGYLRVMNAAHARWAGRPTEAATA